MTHQARTQSYRDFVPNRFRGFTAPPLLQARPGALIITSTGTFVVGADGQHHKRAGNSQRHIAATPQKEEQMPDYKVTVAGADPMPIKAANPTSARNHAVRHKVKVEKLTTEDAIAFGKAGIDLQIAGDDAEQEPVADTEAGSAGEAGADTADKA